MHAPNAGITGGRINPLQPVVEGWQVRLGRAAAVHSRFCRCCRSGLHTPSSHARSDVDHQPRHLISVFNASTVDDPVTISDVTLQQPSKGVEVGPGYTTPHQQSETKRQKPISALSGATQLHQGKVRAASAAKHKHKKPLAPTVVLPSQASASPGTAAIQQIVSKLNTSLQDRDATSCHQALQSLASALAEASAEELLAASSQPAQRHLLAQVIQSAQPNSALAATLATPPPADSTAGNNQSIGTSDMANSYQLYAADPQLLHATLTTHLQGFDALQRADLLLRSKYHNITELFLMQKHDKWAQEFILKMPPQLPENVYITLITVCTEHRSLTTLNAVLEAQSRAGGVLTKAVFRRAKVAFDNAHDLDSVLHLFERAVKSNMADTDVYCDAIESCINSRKFKLAFKIYDRLKSSALELTLHSYHTVLKGSKHLRAAGLQSLYAEMIASQNLVLKDKTFGYVFRAAASCGEALPASWLIQVLSDMNTCTVQMNSHIFTAFLQACTVVPLAAHQVEAVFGAMASYRASQPPTAFVYTSLLTFCAKQAPDRALDVWHAMQEDGVPLTSYLLSSMFAACAAAGTQEMLEAADSSHMHMEGLWNKICSKGKTAVEERDMLRAHNALLHVYASHGQVEKAVQLYTSMQERGPAIDAVSASTIIAAYAKAADQKAALQVFDEMLSRGVKPTAQCYTSLLAACSRGGDLAAARRVFRTMQVEPNVAAYTALMDACLKKGTPAALDEAFEVFEEMKAAGNLVPTATTYGCLLMVCARQGDVDKAFQLYEEAYDTGVLATDECHNILIGICSDAGRVENALDLVKALASKHGSMRQATLNSVIRSLLNVAQVPRALRMLSIMLNLGLKPYKSTVNALIAGCARDSSSVEAAKFYWSLREQGGEASKASGSELIISLCKAGDRLGALKVYEDMTTSSSSRPHTPFKPPPGPAAKTKKSTGRAAAKQLRQDPATAVATAATANGHHSRSGTKSSEQSDAAPSTIDSTVSLQESSERYQHRRAAEAAPDFVSRQGATSAALTFDDAQHAERMGAATADDQASHSHSSSAASHGPPSPAPQTQIRPSGHSPPPAAAQMHTHPLGSSPDQGVTPDAMANDHQQQAHTPQVTPAAVSVGAHTTAAPSTTAQTSGGRDKGSSPQGASTEAATVLVRPSKRTPPQISATTQEHSAEQGSTASSASTSGQGVSPSRSGASSQGVGHARSNQQHAGAGHRSSAAVADAEAAAAAASGHGKIVSSLKLSQKPVFPSIGATAALVLAFAVADDVQQCFRLYQQLQRDKRGLPGLTQSNRRMWEGTIEAACRAGRTDSALQVFDDWKASSMTAMFVQPADQGGPLKLPTLSNATLAFLESCCRGSPEHEWRVYDVCAVMRQQKERKREAALARPAKKSHHVADGV